MITNPFEIFDFDVEYNIDMEKLDDVYYKKMRQLSQSESELEKINASEKVNNAYKILKDKYSRLEFLLKIKGYAIDDINLPQNQLLQIIEDNENLENVLNTESKEKFNDIFNAKQNELMSLLVQEIESKNYEKARNLFLELKYRKNSWRD